MYRYVQRSEEGAWVPIRSEELDTKLKELDAKKVTILEVSELIEDGRDKKSYSYRGPLYFDIDCKEDLKLAIESGKRLVEKLVDLGVNKQGIRIYASGSKGIHVTVDQKYFSSGRAIKGLPLVYKAMAKELHVPGLDYQVYSCGRGNAFRLVNVQRFDGRYRVPVMFEELQDMTPEIYRKITEGPRNLSIMEPTPVRAAQLEALFDAARKEINTAQQPAVIVSSKESLEEIAKEVPPCVQALCDWKGVRTERNLNNVATQVGIYLARVPVSDVVKDGLVSRLAENCKSSKYDSLRAKYDYVSGHIYYMATTDYQFSCAAMRSMLDKSPCKGCPIENSPEAGTSPSAALGLVEREDGMFMLTARADKMLTNFTMTPTDHYIDIPVGGGQGKRVGTRVELTEKGELVATIMFNESSWLSRSSFMRDTTEGHGVLMFFGTDNDVQAIKGHVLSKEKSMGEIYRVHTCGIHMEMIGSTEVFTYVEPDMSINSNRIQGTHEMAAPIVARPYFAECNICAVGDERADNALLNLMQMNKDTDIALMLGWFSACHLKSHIMSLYNQFPILSVWGSAGSGKSVTVGMVSWINGTDYTMRDTPVNVSNITPYAILDYASSTTTVPRVLEEYNKSKMRQNNWKAVGEMLKASWNGETVLRGTIADNKKEATRTGAKVTRIPITSPLVVISEQELEMPALQERSIRVMLAKEKIKGKQEFMKGALKDRMKLREIGKALMAKTLQFSLKEVEALFDTTEGIISLDLDNRPRYSYQVCMTGLLFLRNVVRDDLRLLKSASKLDELLVELEKFMSELGENAKNFNARSEVDAVLEVMNIMASVDYTSDKKWLVNAQHYIVIDDGETLALDPMVPHAMYKIFTARAGGDRAVIERAEQFATLLSQEPYFIRWHSVPGMASGRQVALLSRRKMDAKGIDSTNFT